MTVADLISLVRSDFHDGPADHFSRDILSAQVDGSTIVFALTNRNLITVSAGGAPADPSMLIGGVVTVPISLDVTSGLIQPRLGALAIGPTLEVRYYFELIQDGDYVNFAQGASRFIGQAVTGTWTTATVWAPSDDRLTEAAKLYMVSLAADKMSDLSSWWYQAQAGNKSFNKEAVAKNFKAMATARREEAAKLRDDVYTRFSERQAPSSHATAVTGPNISRPFAPRR